MVGDRGTTGPPVVAAKNELRRPCPAVDPGASRDEEKELREAGEDALGSARCERNEGEGEFGAESRLFLLKTFPKNFLAPADALFAGDDVLRSRDEGEENTSDTCWGTLIMLRRLVGVAALFGGESRVKRSTLSSLPPDVSVGGRFKWESSECISASEGFREP